MTEQELEELRRRFHLVSERDIDAIKEKLRFTIRILQAFLDKPDDLTMQLSVYEDDKTAYFETYHRVLNASGAGYQMRNAKYTSIPFELAKALETFLEEAEICKYGDELEYPKLGTLETIQSELEKELDSEKRILGGIDERIERSKKTIVDLESLLQKVGEHEKEESEKS